MLRDLCNIFLPIFDHPLNCPILSRLLSRQRRIMEGKRGRHNGLQLNELCMGCNLQKHQNSSMIRTTLGNCLKSLNMPRDVLKLPGNVQGSWYYVLRSWISTYLEFCPFFLLFFDFQVEGAPHTQGACWVCCEIEGTWYWNHSATLHCLSRKSIFWLENWDFVLFLFGFVGRKGLE